jgi:hypothetical protein
VTNADRQIAQPQQPHQVRPPLDQGVEVPGISEELALKLEQDGRFTVTVDDGEEAEPTTETDAADEASDADGAEGGEGSEEGSQDGTAEEGTNSTPEDGKTPPEAPRRTRRATASLPRQASASRARRRPPMLPTPPPKAPWRFDMLLASIAGIREGLGFDDMPDINSAIQQSLDAVEATIASLLDTDFAAGSQTDTFFVSTPSFRDRNHTENSFRLRRGFISGTPTVIVTQTAGWRRGMANEGPTDVSSVINVHAHKGVLVDWETYYHKAKVAITYDYGFPVSADDSTSYDLTVVPTWLQTAARLLCLINLADAPVVTEAGVKVDTKMLSKQYDALVNGKLRYAPSAHLPM